MCQINRSETMQKQIAKIPSIMHTLNVSQKPDLKELADAKDADVVNAAGEIAKGKLPTRLQM